MEQINWQEYLAQKKIDARAYQKGSPQQYADFERQFMQMHPDSFTAHKLFLINDIRRSYPLLPISENKKS
ncbi:hypothetical protein [Cesiribacter sp. SM1]|uniref:hypothetical protein n=1 Tax=Cesiribacter sp. SM1 TaxID=2861196 RepID=UPI001CD692D5|nr:hypothetical protein [Cesiribacter sp. SM1]